MATSDLLPLAGVAMGAMLSWGASTLTDNNRFKRERAREWDERRLATYTDFAAATKYAMSILFRVAAGMGLDRQTDPLSLDDAKPLFAAAFHDREAAFERLLLVGSEPAAEVARAWVRNIYAMREYLALPEPQAKAWEALVKEANVTRGNYYALVRKDLGVEGAVTSRVGPPRS